MISEKPMTRREMCKAAAAGLVLTAIGPNTGMASPAAQPDVLPVPGVDEGDTLMQALKNRKSSRIFHQKDLPSALLSDLLWAADGVNREDSGKRTAPSAWNWQNIDIYVVKADGVHLFDAKAHALVPQSSDDIRHLTGTQGFVAKAPLNLIYVADYADLKVYDFKARKRIPAAKEDIAFYSLTNVGFISQNVYLFAASRGLATVVRGLIDKNALGHAMGLRTDQKIILAQSVGYPKKKA